MISTRIMTKRHLDLPQSIMQNTSDPTHYCHQLKLQTRKYLMHPSKYSTGSQAKEYLQVASVATTVPVITTLDFTPHFKTTPPHLSHSIPLSNKVIVRGFVVVLYPRFRPISLKHDSLCHTVEIGCLFVSWIWHVKAWINLHFACSFP